MSSPNSYMRFLSFKKACHSRCVVGRTVLMTATALMWLGLVNDQMPRFMGVPNCDRTSPDYRSGVM